MASLCQYGIWAELECTADYLFSVDTELERGQPKVSIGSLSVDTQGVRLICGLVLIDVQGVRGRLGCGPVLVDAQGVRGRLGCGPVLVDAQGVTEVVQKP